MATAALVLVVMIIVISGILAILAFFYQLHLRPSPSPPILPPTPLGPPPPSPGPPPDCDKWCDGTSTCASHIGWEIQQGLSCEEAIAKVKNDPDKQCLSHSSCQACTASSCPSPPAQSGQEGFRFAPLNFATNRNYFTEGHYGCRIAWIDSNDVPVASFSINGESSQPWVKQGSINVWKGGKKDTKQTPSWVKYSYTNVSLPFGPVTISVGPYTYNTVVPHWGEDSGSDVLFFGDININDGPPGLMGASRVMQTVIGRNTNVAAACFPGDIFYKDAWQDFVECWKTLSNTGGKKITEYMVFGVEGNHDYDINGNLTVSGAWTPVFFANDGLSSFDEGLQNYRQGDPVPLKNSIGVFVLGKTCFILADNKYRGSEIAGAHDWKNFDATLGSIVDTVCVCTHWNGINLGAVSDTSEVLKALAGFFPSRKVRGNTNHVHCNGLQDANIKQTGGNGYHSDCASASLSCVNNSACCPSLYSKGSFSETGYGPGQVCAGISNLLEGGPSTVTAVHEPEIVSKLSVAFDSDAHMNPHILSPEEMIRYYPPMVLNDDYIIGGRSVMPPLTEEELTTLAGSLPDRLQKEFVEEYTTRYNIKNGYPACSALPLTMPGHEGFNCWTTEKDSPLSTFIDLGEVLPRGIIGSSPM